jgi:hypothetical protein
MFSAKRNRTPSQVSLAARLHQLVTTFMHNQQSIEEYERYKVMDETNRKVYGSQFYSISPYHLLKEYIDKIIYDVNIDGDTVLAWGIYIVRYHYSIRMVNGVSVPNFLNELNTPRVILTAALLAHKFFDDRHCSNTTMARVGGLTIDTAKRFNFNTKRYTTQDIFISREMNDLEIEFLVSISFNLYIDAAAYASWANYFELPIPSVEPEVFIKMEDLDESDNSANIPASTPMSHAQFLLFLKADRPNLKPTASPVFNQHNKRLR